MKSRYNSPLSTPPNGSRFNTPMVTALIKTVSLISKFRKDKDRCRVDAINKKLEVE